MLAFMKLREVAHLHLIMFILALCLLLSLKPFKLRLLLLTAALPLAWSSLLRLAQAGDHLLHQISG